MTRSRQFPQAHFWIPLGLKSYASLSRLTDYPIGCRVTGRDAAEFQTSLWPRCVAVRQPVYRPSVTRSQSCDQSAFRRWRHKPQPFELIRDEKLTGTCVPLSTTIRRSGIDSLNAFTAFSVAEFDFVAVRTTTCGSRLCTRECISAKSPTRPATSHPASSTLLAIERLRREASSTIRTRAPVADMLRFHFCDQFGRGRAPRRLFPACSAASLIVDADPHN
jgi:hypothetical protein